jgi:hypothetical protein
LSELCILVWSKAFEQMVQYLSASAGIADNWAKGLHLRYFFVSENYGTPAILARVVLQSSWLGLRQGNVSECKSAPGNNPSCSIEINGIACRGSVPGHNADLRLVARLSGNSP